MEVNDRGELRCLHHTLLPKEEPKLWSVFYQVPPNHGNESKCLDDNIMHGLTLCLEYSLRRQLLQARYQSGAESYIVVPGVVGLRFETISIVHGMNATPPPTTMSKTLLLG